MSTFHDFVSVNFPSAINDIPNTAEGYVYVFFWVRNGRRVPFYVGQTTRLAGRMNDYRIASFSACTDFRVGETARHFVEHKNCQILVKFRVSVNPREEERAIIRELHLEGVRLLNHSQGYDYRTADLEKERLMVHRFCDFAMGDQKELNIDSDAGIKPLFAVEPAKALQDCGKSPAVRAHITSEEGGLTNHERFVEAFKNLAGQKLRTSQIKEILRRHYPEMKDGSMLPNDHGDGNDSACRCAKTEERVFDRVERGVFQVRGTP